MWVRNLGTGASTSLVDGLTAGQDVASNGDVGYSREEGADWNIYRWRTGTTKALTADSYLVQTNSGPRTDGELVVYRKASPCCYNQTFRIAVQDGLNENYLAAPTARLPDDGSWYAVSAGYVAYGVEDGTTALQIWRHRSGGEQQLTFFGSSSIIDAIAPDGTVLFTQKQKRYRAVPGAALQEIGSSLGRVIVRDGKFLVLLDRTVFEVGL